MTNRQTRGRQRIPISRILNQDDLYATFSKRRLGLYKKASQLSTLCGVDIGIIMFSPTNIPYSFFHPDMDSVIDRYRNPNQPRDAYARVVETSTRSRIEALNKSLDEILDEKQKLKEQNEYLNEIDKTRQKGWWEAPIESLNKEQVKEWINWFQTFKAQVESRIEQLQNGASTSEGPSAKVDPIIFAPDSSFTPFMGIEQFSSHHYSVSQVTHNPSFASGSEFTSSQFFLPHSPRNPSISGGNTNPISEQYKYIPHGN